MITALLPLFAPVAPPGSVRIPLTVGAIVFGISAIAAMAAWSAREASRVPLRALGDAHAMPIDESEYQRLRAQPAAEPA